MATDAHHHAVGPAQYRRLPRFETKAGEDSGAGYERWRSWEYRPHTPTRGKENVYVAHHRLLAVAVCYPADMPIGDVLAHLDGRDVHHENGIKWDNRPDNLAVRDHASHARITRAQMRAWAADSKEAVEQEEQVGLFRPNEDCDGCGKSTDVRWVAEDFKGELCTECAFEASDGATMREA